MEPTDPKRTDLVVAAQAGDQRALDQLIAMYLPLLYNIVGRALSGHADVDDVVQDTLLRVVRDLRALRAPESFRSWLVAIAIRQVSLQQRQRRTAAERTTVLDEAVLTPGTGGFEELTILRLGLTGQRREVAEASRWLDPDDRALVALWWQEVAGRITRAELAEAQQLTLPHTAVRLQRMREQLEASRTIVAGLNRDPRCPDLAVAITGWDGTPSPLWRKRLARHTRTCPVCTATAAGRVPTEKLLVGLALLPVPLGLAAAMTAKALLAGTAGAAATAAMAGTAATAGTAAAAAPSPLPVATGPLRALVHWLGAQPVAVVATSAVIVTGAAGYAVVREPRDPPAAVATLPAPPTSPAPSRPATTTASPRPSPSPTVPAGTVPLGPQSLESVDRTGRFLSYAGDFATLSPVSAASGRPARRRATFTVVRGLADRDCVSFRTADGRYLRHYDFRLRLDGSDGTELFREDVTFCPRPGRAAGTVRLRSHNYPDLFLHRRAGEIRLEAPDATAAFTAASSFRVRAPWAP